jgi:hypothetical protein
VLREPRQQLADEDPVDVRRDRPVERAADVAPRPGLRVERVDVARPAPEPDLDDRPRARAGRRVVREEQPRAEPAREREPGTAEQDAAQRLAPRDRRDGQLFSARRGTPSS